MGSYKTLRESLNLPSMNGLLAQLPREKWWEDYDLYLWEGSWNHPAFIEGTLSLRSHFEASGNDIIFASFPKTGTTWMKALLWCILGMKNVGNGYVVRDDDDGLKTKNPHVLVKSVECQLYVETPTTNLSLIPSPRVFHTHLPYHSLLESIRNAESCKLIYVVRNPKDTFISLWHFMNTLRTPEQDPYPLDKAFESFCDGILPNGSFFHHVLEYWNESRKSPEKILFIKYEDLKRDPKEQLKKLSSFLSRPFASEEEVDKVLWRCSLERLKNLEVNKNGISPWEGFTNQSFFRLGVVGDWKHNFTPEMRKQLDEITCSKLQGSSLDL